MNRTRLMYLVNQARKESEVLLRERLGEWYRVIVKSKSDHIADRIMDRSQSLKKCLDTTTSMMIDVSKYFACTILFYADKSRSNGGEMINVILYRKIQGKTFAIPTTIRFYEGEEGEKPLIGVVFRTVIPEYELSLNVRNNINVEYKRPKIVFEYDGYRRRLSRLERLIQSPECPDALKVLRG